MYMNTIVRIKRDIIWIRIVKSCDNFIKMEL